MASSTVIYTAETADSIVAVTRYYAAQKPKDMEQGSSVVVTQGDVHASPFEMVQRPAGNTAVLHTGPIKQRSCQCSPGWILFGVGWLFFPCWIAAMILPCCGTQHKKEKWPAVASGIALACCIIITVVLVATLGS